DPAAAESADAALVHLFLESIEAAERGIDRGGDPAGGRAALARAHDLPEHRVIHVAATVVPDGRANRLRHRGEVLDQILGTLAGELRMLFERGVQIVDVRRVMLAV